MKSDDERTRDWQKEVWRVKEELSTEAKRMGMRKYLAFIESEADRILATRSRHSAFVARDKPQSGK